MSSNVTNLKKSAFCASSMTDVTLPLVSLSLRPVLGQSSVLNNSRSSLGCFPPWPAWAGGSWDTESVPFFVRGSSQHIRPCRSCGCYQSVFLLCEKPCSFIFEATLCEGRARRANTLALVFILLGLSSAQVCCLQEMQLWSGFSWTFHEDEYQKSQRARPPCHQVHQLQVLPLSEVVMLPGWMKRVKMHSGFQDRALLSSLCAPRVQQQENHVQGHQQCFSGRTILFL